MSVMMNEMLGLFYVGLICDHKEKGKGYILTCSYVI